MLLRKSAPSAWDNYTPYGSVFSVDSVWKNLTQRRKGREALRTFVLMSKILHADNAEPRRRFAELCAFAWEENMSFCSYVKKNISLTEYTEFLLRNSIYFFVNRLNRTEWHRILCLTEEHKYWIGASKMRAKITIFQTPVFQLLKKCYIEQQKSITLRALCAFAWGISHRIHGIHRKVSTYLQVSARMFFSH